MYDLYDESPEDVLLLPSIIWIIICIVGLILIKRHFVKSYRAENIGFKTINKTVTFISSISISLSIAIALAQYIYFFGAEYSYEFGFYAAPVQIISIIIIATIVFAYIINSIITTSVKFTKEKMKLILAPLIVVAVVSIYALTGGFGYYNRITDQEKIEEINISTTFNFCELLTTDEIHSFESVGMLNGTLTLSTENDIKIAQEIHKTALEYRDKDTSEAIQIDYKLKNGKTVSRSYFMGSEEFSEKLLTLWETDKAGELRKDIYVENKPTNTYITYNSYDPYEPYDLYYEEYDDYKPTSCFNYKDSAVALQSKDSNLTILTPDLSEEDFNKIKNAIYLDMTETTAEEWFKPQETYGLISFTYNEGYYEEDWDYYADEGVYGEIADILGGMEAGSVTTEEYEDYEDYEDGTYYDDLSYLFDYWGYGETIDIPVTSSTKNTLAVLESLNLTDAFKITSKPTKCYIGDVKEITNWYANAKDSSDLVFHSTYFVPSYDLASDIIYSFLDDEEFYYDDYLGSLMGKFFDFIFNYTETTSEAPVTEITDPDEINELLNQSHFKYYVGTSGKLVILEYDDYTESIYVIP